MESGGLQRGLSGSFVQKEATAKNGAQLHTRVRFALSGGGIEDPFGGANAGKEIEVGAMSSVPAEPR